MRRITFGEKVIASAGYDALRGVMELEFTQTGNISRFLGVSEEIWYGLKMADFPDKYFRTHIRGRYEERLFTHRGEGGTTRSL